MKKKIIELLDKKLTAEYINNYLRSKEIETEMRGDNWLAFKLYDIDWMLYYKDGIFNLRCDFLLDDNIRIESLQKATNMINKERCIVKVVLDETAPQDEEGKPIKDAPVRKELDFSFESLCDTESSFVHVYEFAIYALKDAINYHQELYQKYLKERNTQTTKIGFCI